VEKRKPEGGQRAVNISKERDKSFRERSNTELYTQPAKGESSQKVNLGSEKKKSTTEMVRTRKTKKEKA